MRFFAQFFCVLASLGLVGCSTSVGENLGSKITRRLGNYTVYSPDGTIVLQVGKAAGTYSSEHSDIGTVFLNRHYTQELGYLVRLGFEKAKGTSSKTGVRVMTKAEIGEMKSADGRQKYISGQRVARVDNWDVLIYHYPINFAYEDNFYIRTMEFMLAEVRVGDYILYIENSLSHDGGPDPKYEKLLIKLLREQFQVKRVGHGSHPQLSK